MLFWIPWRWLLNTPGHCVQATEYTGAQSIFIYLTFWNGPSWRSQLRTPRQGQLLSTYIKSNTSYRGHRGTVIIFIYDWCREKLFTYHRLLCRIHKVYIDGWVPRNALYILCIWYLLAKDKYSSNWHTAPLHDQPKEYVYYRSMLLWTAHSKWSIGAQHWQRRTAIWSTGVLPSRTGRMDSVRSGCNFFNLLLC